MGTERIRTVAQGQIEKLDIERLRSYVRIWDKLFIDVSKSVHNISRKNGTNNKQYKFRGCKEQKDGNLRRGNIPEYLLRDRSIRGQSSQHQKNELER
jgi:hypothetical protein